MTMEFREPKYFETFMVEVLDPDGAYRSFGRNMSTDAGATHEAPPDREVPFVEGEDFPFDTEV